MKRRGQRSAPRGAATPVIGEDGIATLDIRITSRTILSNKTFRLALATRPESSVVELREAAAELLGLDVEYIGKIVCGGRLLSNPALLLRECLRSPKIFVTLDEGQFSYALYEQEGCPFTERVIVQHVLMGPVALLLDEDDRRTLRCVCRSWYLGYWSTFAPACGHIREAPYESNLCLRFFRALSLDAVYDTESLMWQIAGDKYLNPMLKSLCVPALPTASAEALGEVLKRVPRLEVLSCDPISWGGVMPVEHSLVTCVAEHASCLRELRLGPLDCFALTVLCQMHALTALHLHMSTRQEMWRGCDLAALARSLPQLHTLTLDAGMCQNEMDVSGLAQGLPQLRSLGLQRFHRSNLRFLATVRRPLTHLLLDESVPLNALPLLSMEYPAHVVKRFAVSSVEQEFDHLCAFLDKNSANMYSVALQLQLADSDPLVRLARVCTSVEELILSTGLDGLQWGALKAMLDAGVPQLQYLDMRDTVLTEDCIDLLTVRRHHIRVLHSQPPPGALPFQFVCRR